MSATDTSRVDFEQVSIGPVSVEIPTDWDLVSLEDVSENSGEYGANASAEPFDPNEFRYIRITDLTEDGQLKDSGKQSIPIEGNEKYQLEKGDLLFARTGAVGRTYLYSESDSEVPCAFAGYLIRFKLSNNIDHDYLRHYTNSEYFSKWVSSVARSTTHANINASEFSSVDIPRPSLPEQRRIADILSTVDEQIQQTDEIIGKRRELRQGLLQELFHRGTAEHERVLDPEELADQAGGVNTGMDQTTVGQVPKKWETERLGELTENSAYGVNASAEAFDPDKPRYLRITDIADDGHLKQDDPKSISRDVSEGYELKPGDLVFARTGATVGKTLLYQEGHPEATYAGYLIRFQLDQTRILPKFAFYYTQTGNYDRWVSRITRQGAQENINTGEYCSILLPLPPIAEQQKIVSIMETVDQKIEQERKTKESLQDLKRGLMQDLLTGKVRVNTN